MAKSMARIVNGIVTNIEWCSDSEFETENLKNYRGYSIKIGDSYTEGKFYRDGEELLSDLEIAQKEIEALKAKNIELTDALNRSTENKIV